jgi:hypothetical protein
MREMAASHASAAPLGLTLRAAPTAASIRLVAAVLSVAALAGAGFVLAFSLPHSEAAPQGSFLGPTLTAPQPLGRVS